MARSSVCQPTLNKKNQLIRGPLFLFNIFFFSLLYTSSPCHQSPPKIYACFNNLKYGFTMEHTTRSPGHNLHHAKGGQSFIIYRSVYYEVYLFAITTYYVAFISFGRILSCQYTLTWILWDRRAIKVGERDIMFLNGKLCSLRTGTLSMHILYISNSPVQVKSNINNMHMHQVTEYIQRCYCIIKSRLDATETNLKT